MNVFQFIKNQPAGLVVPCIVSSGALKSEDKDYTADIIAAVKAGKNVIFNYAATSGAPKENYAILLHVRDRNNSTIIIALTTNSGTLTQYPYSGKL